jgi:AcrR family transcriptional regulator
MRENFRTRREETRERLLEATRELLTDLELEKVTVQRIADKVGLSRTVFYRFFPDRSALLRELAAQVALNLNESARPWLIEETRELRPSMVDLFRTFQKDSAVWRAVLDESSRIPEFGAAYLKLMDDFAGLLESRLLKINPSLKNSWQISRALNLMNERLLYTYARETASDEELVFWANIAGDFFEKVVQEKSD